MYSVIVTTVQEASARATLARNLAPTLGLDAPSVEKMLERGPITVDSSMSEDEAEELCHRLRAMRIPAEVVGEDRTIQSMRLPTPSAGMPSLANFASDMLSEPSDTSDQTIQQHGVDLFGAVDFGADIDHTAEVSLDDLARQARADDAIRMPGLRAPSVSEADDVADVYGGGATIQGVTVDASDFDQIDDFFAAPDAAPAQPTPRAFGAEPGPAASPPVEPARADSSPSDGQNAWSMLFPDLEQEEPANAAPAPSPPPRAEPVAPAVSPTPPVVSLFDDEPALPSFGAEPSAPARHEPTPARAPVSLPDTPSPHSVREREHPIAQPPSRGPRSPTAFEGGKLLDAFARPESGDEPPFKPKGFDSDIPHSKILASVFSAIAPGAGQVYNGDDEDALGYGLKFFLIAPWIKSVKDARAQAEKIEGYWAPRPMEGNYLRTLRYMGAFYLGTAFVCITFAWLGGAIYERVTREPLPLHTENDVSNAIDAARSELREARIAGLDSLGEAMKEVAVKRSTMSDEERANRLYLRGLVECQANKFSICEASMRRVLELESGHRDALRLQTWSSLRKSGGTQPMPDVAARPTLEEFELQQEERLQKEERESRTTPPPKPKDEAP